MEIRLYFGCPIRDWLTVDLTGRDVTDPEDLRLLDAAEDIDDDAILGRSASINMKNKVLPHATMTGNGPLLI